MDKFQGRQAPAVIYSMASSSAEDAPRGLEFLLDLHRLNVATSRPQALAIIVASPDLVRVFCGTPSQMVLANAPRPTRRRLGMSLLPLWPYGTGWCPSTSSGSRGLDAGRAENRT